MISLYSYWFVIESVVFFSLFFFFGNRIGGLVSLFFLFGLTCLQLFGDVQIAKI